MDPAVGVTKPAIALSSVDFPQPEGPSRLKNSPGPMLRSMFSSATNRSPDE
jgi:hypothetical protein